MARLLELIEGNDENKRVVDELIIQSGELDPDTPDVLQKFSKYLKTACAEYVTKNTALVAYYIKQGNLNEAKSARQERFNLLHRDVKECLDIINLQLKELSIDQVSKVGSITSSLLTFVDKEKVSEPVAAKTVTFNNILEQLRKDKNPVSAAKSNAGCSGAAIGNESVKVPYQTVVY